MYTGSYRNPNLTTRNIVTVESVNAIEAGRLVAINVINCDHCPLVAKVMKAYDNNLDIIWLEGSYTLYRPWKTAKRKEGRTLVDWTNTIPQSSVVLFDFELTGTNRPSYNI